MQATECQFIGEWVDGVFMSGTWALQDGSLYKGQFGNKVHNSWFHAYMSCNAVLPFANCDDWCMCEITIQRYVQKETCGSDDPAGRCPGYFYCQLWVATRLPQQCWPLDCSGEVGSQH